MKNINSLKEFLEVYESTGDEFFIWGQQGDPYFIESLSCGSFEPNNADEFVSEFLEREKKSLCSDLDYDFDEEDSLHYVNGAPNYIYIDKNNPKLGVCRILDITSGGDSIYEYPEMNSISTFTRNIVSELCEYSDLELSDITLNTIKEHDAEFGMDIRERIQQGLNPLKTVPPSIPEIFNSAPQKTMNLIALNSLIFNEEFGFGGIVNYFLKDAKQLTCSTMMGATENANTPQCDTTYIGINKVSGLVDYARLPFSLSN